MPSVALLTGGPDYAHDFEATGTALVELAIEAGFAVRWADHPDQVTANLLDGCSALIVNALWWRMLGDVYDDWRDSWAYTTRPRLSAAIEEFVGAGGGLLANHTAPICFDDWPGWADIVGGGWVWGRSAHPPLGPVTARIVAGHPITAGLPERIDLIDEVYGDLAVHPSVEVLATARRAPDDADQPVVWAHRYRQGRVVFTGFGHHAPTFDEAAYRHLMIQALEWVTAK